MKEFRIEIVRRPNDRFAWVFVARDETRRRVLARSARDYRNLNRVTRAIERMQGAAIDVGAPDPEPFPLPPTSFRIVSGVVPLIVDEFPTEYDSTLVATGGPIRAKARPKPKAKPKRAPGRKPKPRGGRGRSAT